ncbi:MAG: anhydro-N-acetylmuramic acid kinase [Cyanobacteria bacterium P01_H01_bin.74]
MQKKEAIPKQLVGKKKALKSRVLGLMSGTSVDGIDACLADFWINTASDGEETLGFSVIATHSEQMQDDLKHRLLACMQNEPVLLAELCQLNTLVGQAFANTAKNLLHTHQIDPKTVDCIGSHGQTVFHLPPDTLPYEISLTKQAEKSHQPPLGSTLQIGDPAIIAQETQIKTIADFRPADMAAGGQGAPLVCFADLLLFQDSQQGRCIQNIGGIGNVTVVPAVHAVEKTAESIKKTPKILEEKISAATSVFAFDTGPGNMLIDAACQHFFNLPYDQDGKIAATGQCEATLWETLIAHPYLKAAPPKSTGREDFGQAYFKQLLVQYPGISPENWVATVTQFTAYTIATAYQQFVFSQTSIDQIVVGGGGAYNPVLVKHLKLYLDKIKPGILVQTHTDFGINNQYKEALAFALLAWRHHLQLPNTLPSCTGARRSVIMGKTCLA